METLLGTDIIIRIFQQLTLLEIHNFTLVSKFFRDLYYSMIKGTESHKGIIDRIYNVYSINTGVTESIWNLYEICYTYQKEGSSKLPKLLDDYNPGPDEFWDFQHITIEKILETPLPERKEYMSLRLSPFSVVDKKDIRGMKDIRKLLHITYNNLCKDESTNESLLKRFFGIISMKRDEMIFCLCNNGLFHLAHEICDSEPQQGDEMWNIMASTTSEGKIYKLSEKYNNASFSKTVLDKMVENDPNSIESIYEGICKSRNKEKIVRINNYIIDSSEENEYLFCPGILICDFQFYLEVFEGKHIEYHFRNLCYFPFRECPNHIVCISKFVSHFLHFSSEEDRDWLMKYCYRGRHLNVMKLIQEYKCSKNYDSGDTIPDIFEEQDHQSLKIISDYMGEIPDESIESIRGSTDRDFFSMIEDMYGREVVKEKLFLLYQYEISAETFVKYMVEREYYTPEHLLINYKGDRSKVARFIIETYKPKNLKEYFYKICEAKEEFIFQGVVWNLPKDVMNKGREMLKRRK